MAELDDADRLLRLPERFPRSSAYDLDWQVTNAMGPNPLWLAESLADVVDVRPGARVLDLGCGRAASAIFLARELGAQVWATDLWIGATANRVRIEEAGMGEHVFPIHAEAHALPFAHGFFDAIVSFDAYHYFGTDALYLASCVRFLKPGGLLGIVVPGTALEVEDVPEHLAAVFSGSDMATFRTPAWWRSHWARTGLVDVERADEPPDAPELWVRWTEGCLAYGRATGRWPLGPRTTGQAEEHEGILAALRADAGRTLTFSRAVARKR